MEYLNKKTRELENLVKQVDETKLEIKAAREEAIKQLDTQYEEATSNLQVILHNAEVSGIDVDTAAKEEIQVSQYAKGRKQFFADLREFIDNYGIPIEPTPLTQEERKEVKEEQEEKVDTSYDKPATKELDKDSLYADMRSGMPKEDVIETYGITENQYTRFKAQLTREDKGIKSYKSSLDDKEKEEVRDAIVLLYSENEPINSTNISKLLGIGKQGKKVSIGVYLKELNEGGLLQETNDKKKNVTEYNLNEDKGDFEISLITDEEKRKNYTSSNANKGPDEISDIVDSKEMEKPLDLKTRIEYSAFFEEPAFLVDQIKSELGEHIDEIHDILVNGFGYKFTQPGNGGSGVYQVPMNEEKEIINMTEQERNRRVRVAFRDWKKGIASTQKKLLSKIGLEYVKTPSKRSPHGEIRRIDNHNRSTPTAGSTGDWRCGRNMASDIIKLLD